MPSSGSNRSNGKQNAQGNTTATTYKSPAPNSQTTSGVSANPAYKHAATSTEDDDFLSNYAGPLIKGISGPYDTLDPSFRKIGSHEEWSFFVTGRVFSMLMWQPADERHLVGKSMVRYGERAYAKIYRFIIIQPKSARHYSKCIRISTHQGQGATKKGLNQSEHCMVYSDNDPPEKLPRETKMNKPPIHMAPCNPTQKLDRASRVDLGKTYPVEHNVKVQEVGMITKIHLKRLVGYVKDLQ
ncbi:hypothetical protein MMC17_000695 [Xylographa soralifera]|nr:hypothetical protein [Xylographa soralifera]